MRRMLAVLFAASVAMSCGGGREGATPATSSARPSSDDTPRDGGTLNRRVDVKIATLNPIITTNREERQVVNYLFTPLVRLDRNLNPVPGLADSWEISPDGKSYTFKLNPRATFSDGTPVRASDVLFTLQKIIDPQNEAVQIGSYFEFLDLAATRVIDEKTIVLAFKEPLASQLVQLNNLTVLPERTYSKGKFNDDFNSVAVGSGPYRLVRADLSREIVLERRTDYWETRPHIQTVVFKVIENATTAWNAVRRGDIDETTIASDLWVRARSDASLRNTLEFRRFYMRAYNFVAWNGRDPLFADPRVRRAMSMCVNLPALINNMFYGTARALNGPFMPDEWAYNADVPVTKFDPAGAKRELASVGWLDTDGDGIVDRRGKPFKFDFVVMSGSPTGMTFAQLLQGELKNIGVRMDIVVVDGAIAIQRYLDGNYQAGYLSWEADPDPDPFALFHSSQAPPNGQNFVYYSNPAADQLIEAGRREIDPKKRAPIYHQLHTVLAADQPYTWTVQASLKWAVNKRVRGVEESRGLGLTTWYPGEFAWWLAQ
jgi:peptide/nickel transport system substrate-binding protein